MRCPDCSKFVSMETEVEVDDLELKVDDGTLMVVGSITVNRNCADCGTLLKSANFGVEQEVNLPDDVKPEDVDFSSLEMTDHMLDASESGGGRYAANMVGYEGTVTIEGKRTKPDKDGDDTVSFDAEIQDAMKASEYEEQV